MTVPSDAIGKSYAIIVDNDTNTANGRVAQIIGVAASTSLAYAFEVASGTYYVYGYVDMNNSGMTGPGGSDYIGQYNSWGAVVPPVTGVDFMCNDRLDITVKVNITLPASAEGKKGFVGIFNTKNYTEIITYGPVAGTQEIYAPAGTSFSVTFTVSPADAGTYYLLGFVDALGLCSGGGNCMPVAGDYIGIYGGSVNSWPASPNVTIDQDITLDLAMTTAVNNVSGTLILPASITNKEYTIMISPEKIGPGMTSQPITKTASASGSSVNYSLFVFAPGSYYILGIVDVDSSGWDNGGSGPVSDGDYVGIYGVTPPIYNMENPFPASPNADLPGTGLNITCMTFYQNGIPPTPTAIPTPSSAGGTGNISGTISLPSGQNGKELMVWLDMDFNPTNGNEVATFTVNPIAAVTESYTFTGVPVASYYIYCATTDGSGPPVAGDAIGVYGTTWPAFPGSRNASVTNGGNLTADITMVTGTNNVSGRVTMPTGAATRDYAVLLDWDIDGGNGALSMVTGTLANANNYFDYSLFMPLPGNYYIYAAVDSDSPYDLMSDGPKCDDWMGYYNFPTAVYMTPAQTNTGKNFSVNVIGLDCK